MRHFLALFWVLVLAVPAVAADAPPTDVLATLRPGHPRIFLTPESLATLRKDIQADPQRAAIFKEVQARADKFLADPDITHKLVGPRLKTSAMQHISTCAFVYLITHEAKYADYAIKDMLLAADFPDWNPSHFLDTATLSCALGVGYDWLYDRLTPEQRTTIRTALVQKGLTPGQKCYTHQESYGWWVGVTHNWAQVCNGGLAIGALAIADEEPAIAKVILTSGLESVQGAMHHFSVDGGWDEGPGYWGYTLQFTSYYMAALQSATGSMQGLEKSPGLDRTGDFRMYFTGPLDRTFNFADASDNAGSSAAMFFLARTFDHPEYAWHHRQEKLTNLFDLLWFDPRGTDLAAAGRPLDKFFRGTNVVFLRSAWNDPKALWVGVKGGDNTANHSHLDLGSFVLDYGGQRFAFDLGSDDYDLPGYFETGGPRWAYYRLRTESHNTLLINNERQPYAAAAPVVAFHSDPKTGGGAVIDLAAGYPMARSVLRGVAMPDRAQILIQDEVQADSPMEITTGLMTKAKIVLATGGPARTATLTLEDQTLYARILEPADAVWQVLPANPPAPQKQNPDVSRLAVVLPGKTAAVRIVVVFSPSPTLAAPAIKPLREWPGRVVEK